MMSDIPLPPHAAPQGGPRWRPLKAIQRRVLGVLAEKAKTTPDVYPLSLNGVVTGANQKSNRAPLMQLEPDRVEEALDELREFGAVGLIEGSGRVQKYRHYLYEWLGVDKVELSVMTELLLRGPQTEGELRGRASRMDPIADLSALRTLLVSLREKGLVMSLTPEGRGHVVTHALYLPKEIEQLKVQYQQQGATAFSADEDAAGTPAAEMPRSVAAPRPVVATAPDAGSDALRREMQDLRAQLAGLQNELAEVTARQEQFAEELRSLKDALGA
jgi:uncharacterized protein